MSSQAPVALDLAFFVSIREMSFLKNSILKQIRNRARSRDTGPDKICQIKSLKDLHFYLSANFKSSNYAPI